MLRAAIAAVRNNCQRGCSLEDLAAIDSAEDHVRNVSHEAILPSASRPCFAAVTGSCFPEPKLS